MTSLTRREISPDAALQLVRDALGHARANGWQVAAAVVDPHGHLVAFCRSDLCDAPVGPFAIDKAYTAGTLGKSSRVFGERMASSPTLGLGLSTRERLLAWGGGVAIYEGEECIGGLGVSGAQDAEDIACAEAAIKAAGLEPR